MVRRRRHDAGELIEPDAKAREIRQSGEDRKKAVEPVMGGVELQEALRQVGNAAREQIETDVEDLQVRQSRQVRNRAGELVLAGIERGKAVHAGEAGNGAGELIVADIEFLQGGQIG